ELLSTGSCVPALAYDLAFPEVFYPTGVPHGRRGFDAVLGNPPWDKIRAEIRSFLSVVDVDYLTRAPQSDDEAEAAIVASPLVVQSAWKQACEYVEGLRRVWRSYAASNTDIAQVVEAAGNWDAYRFFA